MAMRIIIPRSHAELEEGLLPLGRIRHSQTEEKSQKHLHCNSMYRGIVYGYGQNLSGNAIRKQFYFYFDSKKIVPLCFKYCCTLTSLPSKTPAVRQVTVSFKNGKAMGQQSALLKRNSHPDPSPLQAPVADKCCPAVLSCYCCKVQANRERSNSLTHAVTVNLLLVTNKISSI